MHNIESLEKRMAVMETWGRRCNMLLFVVGNVTVPSVNHPVVTTLAPNVELVQLKMNDSYDLLWLKTKLAFSFIVKKYGSEFEWIYKVDDDSFVVIENLKLFLKYENPQKKVYYGCQLQLQKINASPIVYCSGGPGYVMSSHIARQFVDSLKLPDCPQDDYGSEDVNVAVCLALLGIHPSDTRDNQKRFRFVPFPPQEAVDEYLLTSVNAWFYKSYSVQKMQHVCSESEVSENFHAPSTFLQDVDCCSDSAIAYHYVTPSMMKTLEYLIYYLHPFTNREVWIQRK